MITLEQLLKSRDARARHQQDLLEQHPGGSVVCLTVQLPGPQKRSSTSLKIGRAGVKALSEAFPETEAEVHDLETGFEAYLCLPLPALELKRICCGIEDKHPLGRLMDIDVIAGGEGPLSRESIGLSPRRCLLCDNPARVCMRAHTHTHEELLHRIEQLTRAYKEE
ncbi:MAG: citrate lyase holo-[acyl-carrier protein] synthase [Bacteroidales bacterium]|nr:citrate lyase holo-[acyl-carrier protein] synthase [Bacteroidales bacterium]